MIPIKFGWRVPPSPTTETSGTLFVKQIENNLTAIRETFHSAWVTDHFIAPPAWQSAALPRLECWTTICYLAQAFPTLDFGSIVLSQSFRNPALLAKMGATLQLFTGGRFILGIGAGWLEAEYLAYGYEFPRASVRIQQLEEAVQIIKMMWNQTPATFTGEYYQIENALCEPKPDPPPPIMIGGNGEKLTLRTVAMVADWWNAVELGSDALRHKLSMLNSHCQAVGRDNDSIVKTWTGTIAIADTETSAHRIAQMSPRYGSIELLVGTSEQVIEQLHDFTDLGIEYIMLEFVDFPDTAGAVQFAEDVIPAFR